MIDGPLLETRVAAQRMFARAVDGPTVRADLGPCLDFTDSLSQGAGMIRVGKRMVHGNRVALAVYLGRELRSGLWALHHCDRRSCIRRGHLYEGSAQDNIRDRMARTEPVMRDPVRRQRMSERLRGEGNYAAKLNAEAVKVIRFLAARGVSQRRLAAAHGVTQANISEIVRNRTWKESL